MNPNIIQTFYVSSDSLGGSSDFLLTSVDVYFRSKPSVTKNTSGTLAPGVSVYICDVTNETPNISNQLSIPVRKTFDSIYAFADASVATKFSFGDPLPLKSDRFYGVCIVLEDPQYLVWKNIQEEYLLATNNKSTGSSSLTNGRYYESTDSGSNLKYLSDTNITFKVNIAKFSSNTATYILTNEDYEFLSISNTDGQFMNGEDVWQISSNSTGTVSVSTDSKSIIGSGTSFTSIPRDTSVVIDDGTHSQVVKIDYIANDSYMESYTNSIFTQTGANFYSAAAGQVFDYRALDDKLYLIGSTANSSLKFAAGSTIIGEISRATSVIDSLDIFTVDNLNISLDTLETNSSNTAISIAVATANSSNVYSSSNSDYVPISSDKLWTPADVGYVLSRSLEVDSQYLLNGKSINIKIQASTKDDISKIFFFPVVDITTTSLFVGKTKILTSTTEAGYDTEVINAGISPNRYISVKESFANNRFAEDVKVYLNAYRPVGSSIQVYAKVHNSKDPDAFEDKLWTPLQITDNGDRYSSSNTDLIEYTYSIPNYPEKDITVAGSFTSTSSNTIILSAGVDPSANVGAGDLIRLYDPMFPSNYSMHSVQSANSSSITLDMVPANIQSGLKVEKSKYSRAAFTNINNNYVIRYYSENGGYEDTFDTMQIKVVMVANKSNVTPEADSIQVIGVSA